MDTSLYTHTIYLDENSIFIIQKLLYYLEINNVYTPEVKDANTEENESSQLASIPSRNFMLHGIMDVRGKRVIFLIPTFNISIPYEGAYIVYSYNKYQNSEVDRTGGVVRMEHLKLSCPNFKILKRFMYDIEKLEFLIPENKLIKYVWRDSYWKYCNGFKRRKLDTLYLPDSYKKRVISEIERFYSSDSSIYESLCIPERKVFLFWGIPGSGKTTFIRAIASQFNKNIAIVKNTNDMDDAALESMI